MSIFPAAENTNAPPSCERRICVMICSLLFHRHPDHIYVGTAALTIRRPHYEFAIRRHRYVRLRLVTAAAAGGVVYGEQARLVDSVGVDEADHAASNSCLRPVA